MNLKEFSQKIGISQTTISRALNGYPEVSDATRRKVEEAAIRHNYSPNVRAKSLATGRSMLIGHVIPAANTHEMVNPIFGDFLAGASHTYTQRGYDMLISRATDAGEAKTYRDLIAKAAVDGIVVQGPSVNDPRIAVLTDLGIPFVVHGRASQVDVPYSWVDVNNRQSFKRATDFLLDLGHRRIALLNGLETMDFAQRRRQGYEESLGARGIAADTGLMRSAEMTETYGYFETRALLAQDAPPTAFLVASLITANGVARAIAEAGLVIGKDVSVVTHDDDLSYLPNGSDIPVFTATRSSVREAGRIVADMLIDAIGQPHKAPQTVLLEAELVVGQSTGSAPHKG